MSAAPEAPKASVPRLKRRRPRVPRLKRRRRSVPRLKRRRRERSGPRPRCRPSSRGPPTPPVGNESSPERANSAASAAPEAPKAKCAAPEAPKARKKRPPSPLPPLLSPPPLQHMVHPAEIESSLPARLRLAAPLAAPTALGRWLHFDAVLPVVLFLGILPQLSPARRALARFPIPLPARLLPASEPRPALNMARQNRASTNGSAEQTETRPLRRGRLPAPLTSGGTKPTARTQRSLSASAGPWNACCRFGSAAGPTARCALWRHRNAMKEFNSCCVGSVLDTAIRSVRPVSDCGSPRARAARSAAECRVS